MFKLFIKQFTSKEYKYYFQKIIISKKENYKKDLFISRE